MRTKKFVDSRLAFIKKYPIEVNEAVHEYSKSKEAVKNLSKLPAVKKVIDLLRAEFKYSTKTIDYDIWVKLWSVYTDHVK